MPTALPPAYPSAVPGAALTAVPLLTEDHTTEVADLYHDVTDLKVTRRRTKESAATLRFTEPGVPSQREATRRRCVDFVFELPDGTPAAEPWRIMTKSHPHDGQRPSTLGLRPLFLDLGGVVARRQRVGISATGAGGITTTISLVNMGLEEALIRLFMAPGSASWLGMPAWAQLGTVEGGIAGRDVSVFARNASMLDVLAYLTSHEQGACEWQARWVMDAGAEYGGHYLFDFAEEIGRETGYIISTSGGTSGGATINRILNDEQSDSRTYFSDVSAVGQEGITLADAEFFVSSGGSTMSLPDGTIPYDGYGVGELYFGSDETGSFSAVTGASASAQTVTVGGGGVATGLMGRFAADAAGTPVYRVSDFEARAALEQHTRTERYDDVVPFRNLLDEQGVSPDMKEWGDVSVIEQPATPEDPDEEEPVEAEAPNAAFSFQASDLAVSFTNNSSDPGGYALTYEWDFGDDATSTSAAPTHTYAAAGSYTVTLTVTNSEGKQASATHGVTVAAGTSDPEPVGDTPPAVGLSAAVIERDTTVTVTLSVSSDDATERLLLVMDDGYAQTLQSFYGDTSQTVTLDRAAAGRTVGFEVQWAADYRTLGSTSVYVAPSQ